VGTNHSAPVIRFATFELDRRTKETRKGGVKLKLSGQPFEVLSILLEQPGQLVSREQFQQRLWPDTFVDVDHNLNAAINKIRETLGDSAENPRFVETLPRLGYRFIAPVEIVFNGSNGAQQAQSPKSPQSFAAQRSDVSGTAHEAPRSTTWLIALIALAIVALAGFGYRLLRPAPQPALAGYTRLTNDGRSKRFRYDALPVIATDGSRLYFTEAADSGSRLTLTQASVSGGDTSIVPTPLEQNIELSDISSDHSELLLHTFVAGELEMPAWILPLGGSPQRVGDVIGRDATFSPDRQQIAYANGQDLFICKRDGSDIHKLVTAPGIVRWPRWSPDGRVLRFSVGDPAAWTYIEEVSSTGGNARPLLPAWKGSHCCGTWTRDGHYFVFQSSAETTTDIWALQEQNRLLGRHAPFQVTAGPMDFNSPVPTADGKKLLVIGEQRRGELLRLDRISGQFVPYLGGISAQDVDVSADGQSVAYVSYPERVLWRSRIDGSHRLQLTAPPMQVALPRWSPDGKQIAFSASQSGGKDKIYLIPADGGKPTQLTDGDYFQTDPTWSKDQTTLMFGGQPWLDSSSSASPGIHIVDLKTRRLSILPGSQGLYSPHLSPDGRYLIAMSFTTPNLMLFDFSSQKWVELRNGPAAYPNWSRDSAYIYFINPYVAEPALCRLRIKDRKIDVVKSLERARLGWSIAGKWTGLAADDSPLVLRDTGTVEIYSLDWHPR
jgi:Tol biopolymer transport system component/DNA-binding winged helix-turn-helix (wHTH) protein